MTPKLNYWLLCEFKKANQPKYFQYFDEWISHITQDQIEGFSKQMFSQEEQTMIL